ncbi:DapH/DapD/GlmU-related protein [Leisingera sp. XS_AS12]
MEPVSDNKIGLAPDVSQVKKQRVISDIAAEGSALQKYTGFFVGKPGLAALLHYELVMMLAAGTRGALGYALRKSLFPALFASTGGGVNFGRNIALRCPSRIELGAGAAIDDNCMLDARGIRPGERFRIGAGTLVARDSILLTKSGPVSIGENCSIGAQCFIGSVNGISLGNDVLVGGQCYIGGGRYLTARGGGPMARQDMVSKGPIEIDDDVWIGAGATILDGAVIGTGAVVGAGAVVTGSVRPYAVAVGVPAREIGQRA